VKQAAAAFRSLKDAWCDTTTPHGVPMLTILGGLAEFERTLIRARNGEGRERAKGAACASDARASFLLTRQDAERS
jgi:DNA invertase Pin-like site-specific DNA recombinase